MYHGIYTGIYHHLFDGIYYDIYHDIYHDLTDAYYVTTLGYSDCTGKHACTYCTLPHATATASNRQALHNRVACVLMNISQARLQTGAVAFCMLRSVCMQRPVPCGCQCN
jgi:hypothetical protein